MFFVFQLSIEQAQTVAEQVEMKAKVVQSEVKAVTARHKKALEERECELLWKVMDRAWPPPVWAAPAGQHFFREPHVRPWTPALNLEYLVVFQWSLAEKFRDPWNLMGALGAVKQQEAFSELVGYQDWKASQVLYGTHAQKESVRGNNRNRCYESRLVGNTLIFGVLAGCTS